MRDLPVFDAAVLLAFPHCGPKLEHLAWLEPYARVTAETVRSDTAVLYGAGPSPVLESNAKRGDEHQQLADLRCATKVVARTLRDVLGR